MVEVGPDVVGYEDEDQNEDDEEGDGGGQGPSFPFNLFCGKENTGNAYKVVVAVYNSILETP